MPKGPSGKRNGLERVGMSQFRIPWSGRSHDYTEDEIQFIADVIRTADPLTEGKYRDLFEQKLTKYFDVPEGHIFTVDHGTSALELIAGLCHIEHGDEVIIPAHTFTSSAVPFLRRGAKIVWADIDRDTWTIDDWDVAGKFTKKTKAIELVHLYGLPADIDNFRSFGVTLIEDAAQALGANYKGVRAGVQTDFGAFSFHGQKNMSTFGEGGAIYVRDPIVAAKIPALRDCGIQPYGNKDYWIPAMVNVTSVDSYELPHMFILPEVPCAIGSKLIERLDDMNDVRGSRYWEFRTEMEGFPELRFQSVPSHCTPSYHLMPAIYEGTKSHRNDVIRMLSEQYGIKAIVQYNPLYRYGLYKDWGCGKSHCPNTDYFFDNMISFPNHVCMSENDFEYMIDSTKKVLEALRNGI